MIDATAGRSEGGDAFVQGVAGIRRVGHRDYVGGMWDEIGRLQSEFLVRHGLCPQHEMAALGADRGWRFRYIGHWGHPRGQVMTEYSTVPV